MAGLIQLIYSSAAKHAMQAQEIETLLSQSRQKNAGLGITGMLLYIDGSFFQVLEGEKKRVEGLFETISEDDRHTNITIIMRETVKTRAFADWSMGYANLSPADVDTILGGNDFFSKGESFKNLTQGRAKKLLFAFKVGRWRSRLGHTADKIRFEQTAPPTDSGKTAHVELSDDCKCSFAFQPIVNVADKAVFSYEALLRGRHRESAEAVLSEISPADLYRFDTQCREQAVKIAAKLGLTTHLNLNMLPGSIETAPTVISTVVETAEQCGFRPDQIIIEILEHDVVKDPERFARILDQHRSCGVLFAIDDFGSGYAGLNLLADFQPEFIKLDLHLVRDINRLGAKQAIVRGIVRTCFDLGIEIIAEGVETEEEYTWLHGEGIDLFQGFLFAEPEFESLTSPFDTPTR